MGTPSALNSSSDASSLRRLLERQQACLMRVRLIGVLLWCNRAALSFFGVAARRAILGTNLLDRIAPAQRPQCQEFMQRCWETGAASFECDVVIANGDARRVLIQGVALRDGRNGFESLLLQVGVPADEARAERERLMEALLAQSADRKRREATFVALQKKFEESQLAFLQKEREYGRDVAMLKAAHAATHAAKATAIAEKQDLDTRIQAATAEQARLHGLVADYEADRARIVADHQDAVHTLEQSLAQALAEQHRIAARAEEQTREQDLMRAALQRALVDLEARDAALADRLEVAERGLERLRAEHHRTLADRDAAADVAADLQHHLSEASAEQGRLAARVEEQEREKSILIAEHHRALAAMEAGEREIAELQAEQMRLQAFIAAYELDRTRTAADHQSAIDTLEQSLAQVLTDQGRMAARAEEQTRERDLMRDAHQRALVDLHASKDAALDDLRSELARTLAEQRRRAEQVEAAARELDLLRAGHDRAQECLIAEHQRALADVEAGKREALDELQSQQSQALAVQRRLVARLEEHEGEREALIAEHRRALADIEAGKAEALAALRSQLSQAFADQRRLATRADEQQLELDRLRAEHYAALTDAETKNSATLAELRAELSQTAAAHTGMLAERAEQHERGLARTSAEHGRAMADLQAGKEAAVAELRSQLSAALAEHHRLTALLEDGDRERERMAAEHRRTIAELQASQKDTVAECERILLEVQQALLVRDASRRVDIERRLVDGIDEGPVTKADGERLASLQRGITLAFSRVHAVLGDSPAEQKPSEPEPEDADLLHEPFDDADEAFVHQLLDSTGATRSPENLPDPQTSASAQAVSGTQTPTEDDQPADAVFDARDAAFARSLMDRHRAAQESVDQPDADPPPELPQAPPAVPEDS